MSFFVNPHETYIFRVVKLLMSAQSFQQSFELESGRERGGKKGKQKLLCAAKKYHCEILVFIARRCLPSVAESAFFLSALHKYTQSSSRSTRSAARKQIRRRRQRQASRKMAIIPGRGAVVCHRPCAAFFFSHRARKIGN